MRQQRYSCEQFAALSNCNKRQRYRYARFDRLYPDIVVTLSPQLYLRHETPALAGINNVPFQKSAYLSFDSIKAISDALRRKSGMTENLHALHEDLVPAINHPMSEESWKPEQLNSNLTWIHKQINSISDRLNRGN